MRALLEPSGSGWRKQPAANCGLTKTFGFGAVATTALIAISPDDLKKSSKILLPLRIELFHRTFLSKKLDNLSII
jgi:hypothetical protein